MVEVAGGAAGEREPLYGGPPIGGERVHQVRQEVRVRCSRGSERPGLRMGSRGDGGKRTKGAVGSRGDINGGRVTRGKTPGEGREKMNNVGDAAQGQAGKERVHLFSPRHPISGGGGREAVMSATVPPGVRTIRRDAGTISAREVRVISKGFQKQSPIVNKGFQKNRGFRKQSFPNVRLPNAKLPATATGAVPKPLVIDF